MMHRNNNAVIDSDSSQLKTLKRFRSTELLLYHLTIKITLFKLKAEMQSQ